MKYFLSSLLLLIIASLSIVFWYFKSLEPVSKSKTETPFTISKSEAGNAVIARLFSHKLIKSEIAAKIFLKLAHSKNVFKPGEYVLSPNSGTARIFDVLISGPEDIRVTIPEGWRREQISQRLESVLDGFNTPEFLKLTQNLEGRLFPDTYFIPVESTPDQLVKMFTQNFTKKTGLDMTKSENTRIIIMASLIERETKSEPDRQLVAGIIAKRLENDWPLQVDATVQYAVNKAPDWWSPIQNTKYPSLYNTYIQTGLPPGPICNPGLASIRAAENPQNSPYWYYLTGTDGVTRYATDLAGHNLNVDKYLRP